MDLRETLEAYQSDHRCLILDGGLGTELQRRGLSLDSSLWSSTALKTHPQLVQAIHEDYLHAGADLITANTFRLHQRNLIPHSDSREAKLLVRTAVELARNAIKATHKKAFVLGSLAPVEDCYRPELCPTDAVVRREHRTTAQHLADAGVDGILTETQNSIREAKIATQAAVETGRPVLVSFICRHPAKLYSGEWLSDAVKEVLPDSPVGILVNCLAVADVPDCLQVLRENVPPQIVIGAYANTGLQSPSGHWAPTKYAEPNLYANAAQSWRTLGATLIGGCCGTTPEHVRALDEFFGR